MMGANHAAMGACSWFALTAAAPFATGVLTTDPHLVLIGMLTTAGAALLPDWDHRSATISWSLPPISNLISAGFEKLGGGHRAGTHSLLGILFFTVLAWAAGLITYTTDGGHTLHVGAGIICLFLGSLALGALKIIRPGSYLTTWGIAAGFGCIVAWFAPANLWWLPFSIALGVAIHIIGDLLTVGGVKILWPFTTTNIAFPVLGKTGSGREWFLGTVFIAYSLYGLGWAGLNTFETASVPFI